MSEKHVKTKITEIELCTQCALMHDFMKYVPLCQNLETLSVQDNEGFVNHAVVCVLVRLVNLQFVDVHRCDHLMPEHVRIVQEKLPNLEVFYFTPHSVMMTKGHEWIKLIKAEAGFKIEYSKGLLAIR